ncbi:3-mercaptopyruvate sulfurtransferase [Pigmentiphaga humi]|uniref:Sulfurtransferase n=1 Tax=Pigmentiphaga humi TaxID=2478468 RepID=A0A3P4B378_9BURK|nr:sulfurtransferase [Pigmentiphaga humi]VCU70088.1 3-mercaptopyruvate sulfurtransferase [Pigmentiphaga humi]
MNGPAMDDSALIRPQALQRAMAAGGVVVIDCTSPLPPEKRDARREFEDAHIPGARFLDLAEASDPHAALPNTLPTRAHFEQVMRRLGVRAGDCIVVYDTYGVRNAPRLWWMLKGFGHARVAVLDGGLPAWRAAGLALASGPAAPAGPGDWQAVSDAAALAGQPEAAEAAADPHGQLLDARSAERYQGLAPEPRPGLRAGHIPGSLNLPYERLLDPRTQSYLPAPELAEALRAHGVELGQDKRFVCSCGSGVSACVIALALHMLGERQVKVYDGSWSEWGANSALPIETGETRKQ